MAILFIDGADHYASADTLKKWKGATQGTLGTDIVVHATEGRRGGGCLKLKERGSSTANNSIVTHDIGASVTTIIVGFAWKTSYAANPPSTFALVELRSALGEQLSLRHLSTGEFAISRGGTTLGTVVPTSVTEYQYYELKATIDDTSGAYELRRNGVAILSGSNVDTKTQTDAGVNSVRLKGCAFNGGGGSNFQWLDDMYIADTAGSVNNDFLGDVRIDPIFPNGAGTHQSWTPSTGTDHAALIDETAPNTTDYLTGSAAGSKETATLQDLSVNGAILAIQVNAALAKTDAGACTTKNLIRSGTTEANGAVFAPATGYLYSSSIHEADPATSAPWLTAAVNALEAGVEVVS